MPPSLRQSLDAVVAELKRLRGEGVASVYLAQTTMDALKARAKELEVDGFADVLASQFGIAADGAGDSRAASDSATGSGRARAAAATGETEKNPFMEEANLVWPQADKGSAAAAAEISATVGGVRGAAGSGSESATTGAAAFGGDDEAKRAAAQGLPEGVKPIPDPVPFELPQGDKQTRWDWLENKVKTDPVCLSHIKRGKKLVLGVGSLDADIFFCGEAPGQEEEEEGEPFVGPAGQLLTKIILAMSLKREQVYIGNILNWRPEHDKPYGNRPPVEAEIRYCLPHLLAQLEIVRPKVIVALGLTAANGLLGHDPNRRLGGVRGRWLEVGGYPLMVTYHPSYLLRNGTLGAKRVVWEDMMLVMEKVGMAINAKQRAFFTKA